MDQGCGQSENFPEFFVGPSIRKYVLGWGRYKKQDRRNLGVPAILTNHNKQTYANYALLSETVAIGNKIFSRNWGKLLQVTDIEGEKFQEILAQKAWESGSKKKSAEQFWCDGCFEFKPGGSNFESKVNPLML